jgi:hypothetical protein
VAAGFTRFAGSGAGYKSFFASFFSRKESLLFLKKKKQKDFYFRAALHGLQ